MSTELYILTKAEIGQRELASSELWIIKRGEEITGPYEIENLKAYVQENEALFEEALASRMEPQQWQPLFSYPHFQRRSPQILNTKASEGPFWVYQHGLKTGPFEKFYILKSLEMNSLIVTDKISTDDGKTWFNIYEIPDFDRRDVSFQELPPAPEQTLAQMYGKVEVRTEHEMEEMTSEFLASSAHRGLNKNKVLQFKTENYSLPQPDTFWSHLSLPEWFMPSAIALSVMIVGAVIYSLTPSPETQTLSVANITEKSRPLGEKRVANPSAQLDRTRSPASVKNIPVPRKRQVNFQDNIPTTIQTHHVDRYPSNDSSDPDYGHHEEPYTDPYDNPFEEDGAIIHEAPPAASLVPPRKRPHRRSPSASSVSDVMGYEENLMDEASDF